MPLPAHTLRFVALVFLSKLSLIFLSPEVEAASTLECYKCVGTKDSECELGFDNSTATCETNIEQCITLIIDGISNGKQTEVVYKGCFLSCQVIEEVFEFLVTRSTQGEFDNVSIKSCKNCNKTNCNSGLKLIPSATFVALVVIVYNKLPI